MVSINMTPLTLYHNCSLLALIISLAQSPEKQWTNKIKIYI